MRKDTLFIVTPIIGGAFGLFLRWLQISVIFDPETGLAARNAGLSWALVLLCIAYAALCFFSVRKQAHTLDASETRTVFGGGKALCIFEAVMGGLTAVGGLLVALAPQNENKILWLIFALLCIFTGVSMLLIGLNKCSDAMRGLCCAVPIVTCCFWLVLFYKVNANEPVLWKYAMDFVAISANAIAWYFVAGFHYEAPKPARTLFFCQLAVFLDVLVMADSRSIGLRLLFLCPALMLFCLSIRLLQSAGRH